jgi:hypothetical protein
MILIFGLISILLPRLLVLVALLYGILFIWRTNPIFKDVLNLKQPFWVLLFISFVTTTLSYLGIKYVPAILYMLHSSGNGYNGMGFYFLLALCTYVGSFIATVSSFVCLWNLVKSILQFVRNYKITKS